ncbi:MAG: M20/M25/M40 family metallo-hydrolase [Planctomycetota bacterium]|jgi:hypothetical protein
MNTHGRPGSGALFRVLILLAILLAGTSLSFPQTPKQSSSKKQEKQRSPKELRQWLAKSITSRELSDHVKYLASPELEGRGTAQKGGKTAAEWIAKEFEKYGLVPGGDNGTYLQKFPALGGESWNVIGSLTGTHPSAKDQAAILGAHYDHWGKDESTGVVKPGADDNASGTAGVLEVAQAFADGDLPHDRTIVFICFGAEEHELIGSKYYVRNPAFPLGKTIAMVNLDMLARGGARELTAFNAGPQWDRLFEETTKGYGFRLGRMTHDNSDHFPFQGAGVPAFQLNTGAHPDLHEPTDTHDRCDFKKSKRVTEIVGLLMLELVSRKGMFQRSGWERVYAGRGGPLKMLTGAADIPAEAREKHGLPEDQGGVLVEAVAGGGAGGASGFKGGDIIIEFNGQKLPKEDAPAKFTQMLAEAAAGASVECIVLRPKGGTKPRFSKRKLRVRLPKK